MKAIIELVSNSKVIRFSKNETNLSISIDKLVINNIYIKSRIVYDDSICLFNLSKEELLSIIETKNTIMNKVVFNGDRFAMQNQLTADEFTFIRICDNKKISRSAIIN